jgi:hypothetical protein
MYNLRYHIASLVAVFLALAVGLVLGTVVAERGMLTDRSSALVEDLQRRFDTITADNDELRAGLERDRAFAADAVPLLTADVLRDQEYVVLVLAGKVDGLNAAQTAISDAGAVSSVATLDEAAMGLRRTVPAGVGQYLQSRGLRVESPGEALEVQVAVALVEEWRQAGDRPLTSALVSAGVLAMDSLEQTATIDGVVLMARANGGCDTFALAVGDAMKKAGGAAVGAESLSSPDGVARSCVEGGFSAVDHVATPQGRFSLVWILSGRAEGFFGAGDGADAYYPLVPGAD